MNIDRIELREIRMPLLRPFQTSFGTTDVRRVVLVEAIADGVSGWGEVTAKTWPLYNEEFVDASWELLARLLGPRLLEAPAAAADVAPRLNFIRGHRMTRAALETAVWDLEAKLARTPLWRHIGGEREELPCGVSIGIQPSLEELLDIVDAELAAGYRRIKLKIKPGTDLEIVAAVRERHPGVSLSVDANSAYRLSDADHLMRLDGFDLLMIEQPLAHDDIVDHARLQGMLRTSLCLDESIRTARSAEQALELGSCRIINIKLGRVGGYAEAILVHNVARAAGVPVWCGGMLETGVGRAHNIALSTLENFTLPGDVSSSKRYWERDIIDPPVEVSPAGALSPPSGPGIGYEVDVDYVDSLTVRRETVSRESSP